MELHCLTSNISQQHLVFGAGLIGCFIGGALSMLGKSVSLVCRPKIKESLGSGIRLTDYTGNDKFQAAITCIDNSLGCDLLLSHPKIDFLWLTVKCTGIDQALIDMKPWVSVNTLILCCQNGLGSDAKVRVAYPNNQVLRVMVPFNVVELQTGHYHRGSEGSVTIEETHDTAQQVTKLVNELQSDILPITSTQDMNALLWAKLQLNLGNSVNALADIPVKAMLQQREYRKVIVLLMEELLIVTDALDIKLPKITAVSAYKIPFVLGLPNFIFSRVANKMLEIDPKVRSSMWWDVSQGKLTEIVHINGAVLKHAKKLGISCPANETMCTLIANLRNTDRVPEQQLPPISAKMLLLQISKSII